MHVRGVGSHTFNALPPAVCRLVLWCGLLSLQAVAQQAPACEDGGGDWAPPPAEELTAEARATIQAELDQTIDSLEAAGVFARYRALHKTQAVAFEWPIACESAEGVYGCHAISNYVDHDTTPGVDMDFMGGTISYDGHKGTDFWTYPFAWYQMDHGTARVVAAAPGVITGKRDGNFDRSCATSGGQWNAVYIRHADNTVAWYGHFKDSTVTSKAVGDTVQTGEYLGVVGSSGNSTGPHLHFEVHDASGDVIDPWAGPENPTTAVSWWREQRPYLDAGVNRLMSHSTVPVWPACPGQEELNSRNAFMPGDSLYCIMYIRHPINSLTAQCRVRLPDSSVWSSWTYTHASTYSISTWRYRRFRIPATAQEGVWTFEVDYDSLHFLHAFTVGTVATSTPAAAPRTVHGTPVHSPGTRFYDLRGRRCSTLPPRQAVSIAADGSRMLLFIRVR